VVDPLDGTASYVRGYPGYCSSIGVEVDGVPTVGVTVDSRGVRTEGVVGVGAFRGERRIAPSTRTDLAACVLATGFGYDAAGREQQGEVATFVLPRVADVRRSGSAAFDLVASACGEVDAYYEIGLNPWDLCAGQAIVRAAGGICRSIPQPSGARLVISAPTQLFEPLAALLADAGLTTT
jgi:myo-inositol-1(or 4)-monophosphatase